MIIKKGSTSIYILEAYPRRGCVILRRSPWTGDEDGDGHGHDDDIHGGEDGDFVTSWELVPPWCHKPNNRSDSWRMIVVMIMAMMMIVTRPGQFSAFNANQTTASSKKTSRCLWIWGWNHRTLFCFWLPCVPFISPVSKARPLLRKPAREFVRDPDVRKDWPLALIDQFSLLAHAHLPPRDLLDLNLILPDSCDCSITRGPDSRTSATSRFHLYSWSALPPSRPGIVAASMPGANPFPYLPLNRGHACQ